MSDGLTDGYRSSLAAERKLLLFRSVIEILKDWNSREKMTAALNDVMAYQDHLFDSGTAPNREAAAGAFLERLLRRNHQAWAQLLSFALRDQGSSHDAEYRELKSLSPFQGKTLVIAFSGDSGLQLQSTRDLQQSLRAQARERMPASSDKPKLLALDIEIASAFDLKP